MPSKKPASKSDEKRPESQKPSGSAPGKADKTSDAPQPSGDSLKHQGDKLQEAMDD